MTGIDARDLARLQELVRTYELDRDPHLAQLLHGLTNAPDTLITRTIWRALQERVARYAAYHETYPFMVPTPAAIMRGRIKIGHDHATGTPITLDRDDLARHLLAVGATGSGKTTLVTHLVRSARQDGITVWIVDPKDDYRHLATEDQDFLLFHPELRVNLLEREDHLTPTDLTNSLVSSFTHALWTGQNQQAVLADVLRAVLLRRDPATIAGVRRAVDEQYTIKETYARRDQNRAVSTRLQGLIDQFPGPTTTSTGIPLRALYEHSLYLPITADHGSTGQFLLYYLVHKLYLHQRARQERGGLSHLIVIDEGLQTLGARPNTIDDQPPLSHLQSLVREYGIGLLVTTTNLTLTDPLLQSNAGTLISLTTRGGTETRVVAHSLGLNSAQTQYHQTHLTTGQAIIRVPGWGHPILATIPVPNYDKTVTTEEWARARERTTTLTPPPPYEPPTPQSVAPPPSELAPSPPPAPASTKPLARRVATLNETLPKAQPPLALTRDQQALLHSACARLAPATTHYEALKLHPQAGTRAKDHLLTLGLLTQEHVVIRAGRGGTATLLVPTTFGYERTGKRPKGTRGGDSVQHRYLVQELHRHLPGSTIEAQVGTKSVDLLVRLTPEHHPLLTSITTHAQPIATTNDHQLASGDLLAIEVEVSDPLTTGTANVQKNHAAGITTTLLAVLPKHVTTTTAGVTKSLTPSLQRHALVIDALRLLDDLRGTPPGREGGP
ncbi:MAG: DUF853 family protein [Acidobacteriota bacterium]|nr:DUF853 family protein [Acidobacteriota bacterium]